jgi:hypothetical protein
VELSSRSVTMRRFFCVYLPIRNRRPLFTFAAQLKLRRRVLRLLDPNHLVMYPSEFRSGCL